MTGIQWGGVLIILGSMFMWAQVFIARNLRDDHVYREDWCVMVVLALLMVGVGVSMIVFGG